MFKKSSLDLFYEEKTKGFHIKSFLRELDNMLEGGIPSGIITEFCGGPGTGKTHMCLQMCLHVQLIDRKNSVKAVFIDTNQGLNPFILKEMASYTSEKLLNRINVHITEEEFLSNIQYVFCNTIEEMGLAIDSVENKLREGENIKLIVIDSFSSIFRSFQVPNQLRMKTIFKILTQLQVLAHKYESAIIVTNELTTKIIENNEAVISPALGETYAHKIGQRMIFENEIGQRRIYLHKTIYAPNVRIPCLINKTGIRGINTVS